MLFTFLFSVNAVKLVYMGVLFVRFPLAAGKGRHGDPTDRPRRAPPGTTRRWGASQNLPNSTMQHCLRSEHRIYGRYQLRHH